MKNNQEKTVKSCKNCTISEMWAQITGLPDKLSPADPYSLFNNLRKELENKPQFQGGLRKGLPVLLNIGTGQHEMDICPPFWNGEIRWTEKDQKQILRTGHQFFALHAMFNGQNSYNNYRQSFETAFQKIINYVKDDQAFEVAELKFQYVNTIGLQRKSNGEFDFRKYFNAGFFHNLKHPIPIKYSNFSYEFNSKKSGIMIGININIKSGQKDKTSLIATIETTGRDLLNENIKLNDRKIIQKTKLIKEELKTVFFDFITENTKDNIMEVQYA